MKYLKETLSALMIGLSNGLLFYLIVNLITWGWTSESHFYLINIKLGVVISAMYFVEAMHSKLND